MAFCCFTQSRTLAELQEVVGGLGDNIGEELYADKAINKVRNCKLGTRLCCDSLPPFQTMPDRLDAAIHLHSILDCTMRLVLTLKPKKVWLERAHLLPPQIFPCFRPSEAPLVPRR